MYPIGWKPPERSMDPLGIFLAALSIAFLRTKARAWEFEQWMNRLIENPCSPADMLNCRPWHLDGTVDLGGGSRANRTEG